MRSGRGPGLAPGLGLNLLTPVVTCCIICFLCFLVLPLPLPFPSLPWAGIYQGKCQHFNLLLGRSFLGQSVSVCLFSGSTLDLFMLSSIFFIFQSCGLILPIFIFV